MFMTVIRFCTIKHHNNIQKCGWSVIALGVLLLAGCQHAGPAQLPAQARGSQTNEQSWQMHQVQDGIQNIRWELTEIQGEKAKFFHAQPYLELNSGINRIQGNTGCNSLNGSYEINTAQHSLSINVRAGYDSCDAALAQEAMLADALQQVARFQLSGDKLALLDRSGQMLLQARRK